METDHTVGIVECMRPTDDAAPIAPLCAVFRVAEPLHQFGQDVRHPFRIEPALGRLVGEAETWQGCSHHMERIGRVSAVSSWVGEGADDL